MNIEVVLTQNDPKLGQRGQVVKVARGFAYNFLIPQGKAKLATASALKSFEAEKAKLAEKEARTRAEAEELAAKIAALSLALEVQAGETDKLYGAVTVQNIQEALSDRGIQLDRKAIHLEEPIHKLGVYTLDLKIHPQITAKLELSVVKKK